MIHTAHMQDAIERNRAFEELTQNFARMQPGESHRRMTAFRLSGGGSPRQMGYPQRAGSFQHLKVSFLIQQFLFSRPKRKIIRISCQVSNRENSEYRTEIIYGSKFLHKELYKRF